MRNYLPSEVRLGERKITSVSYHIFFLSSRFKKDPSKNGGAKLWHEVFKVYAVRFQSIFLGKLDIRFSWRFAI